MHLLLISDYYKPIIKSGAIIIEDLALEFTKQGHKVTVVTFTDSVKRTKTCSDQNSVNVIRIPSPLRKFGKVGRLIAQCLYSAQINLALSKEIKDQNFDGIICYSPSIFYGSAIKKLKEISPLTIKSTFLGAHAIPEEYSKERYLEIIIKEMLPQIQEENLADYVDVFCEIDYFNIEDTIKNDKIKITKLAQGLPVGGEIEQLDDGTLFSAFKNRVPVTNN